MRNREYEEQREQSGNISSRHSTAGIGCGSMSNPGCRGTSIMESTVHRTRVSDVTIDLGTTEDWSDVDDKAKQNQVREEFDKLEQGREKCNEYQAEKNRDIRKKYSLTGMGETPEMECDGCDNYAVKSITASLGAVGGGLLAILGSVIYGLGAAESVAVLIIVGAGLSLLGLGLFVIGISLAVYYGLKWVECKRGSS